MFYTEALLDPDALEKKSQSHAHYNYASREAKTDDTHQSKIYSVMLVTAHRYCYRSGNGNAFSVYRAAPLSPPLPTHTHSPKQLRRESLTFYQYFDEHATV